METWAPINFGGGGVGGSSWNQYPVDTERQLKLDMTDDEHDRPAPLTPAFKSQVYKAKISEQ